MDETKYRLIEIKNGKRRTIGEIANYTYGDKTKVVKWKAKNEYNVTVFDLTHDQAIDYVAEHWTKRALLNGRYGTRIDEK